MARKYVRSRRMLLAAAVAVAVCASWHAPLAFAQDAAPAATEAPVPEPTTAAPTDAPTDAPAETPAPTEAPTPTPTVKSGAGSGSSASSGTKSTSASASGSKSSSGATITKKPVVTTKKPTTTKPLTTAPTTQPTPTTTAPGPFTTTPTPTSTSSNSDSTNSKNNRDKEDKNKTIALIVVSGIAAVCALGLLVVCFLRRSRDDLDDMASPLPHFTNQPSATNGPVNNRSSLPTGAGAANYYPTTKLSGSGAPLSKAAAAGGSATSPTAPPDYRPSNRLTNISRKSSRGYYSGTFNTTHLNTNNSFNASNTSPLDTTRPMGNSETSSFSVRGESELRRGSETSSSVDIMDRTTYDSRISMNTDSTAGGVGVYRFTQGSSLSSLHDNADEDINNVVNRGLSASSVDEGPGYDEALSQSIGGSNVKNWYDAVDSPTSQGRNTYGTNGSARESTDRQSFEL